MPVVLGGMVVFNSIVSAIMLDGQLDPVNMLGEALPKVVCRMSLSNTLRKISKRPAELSGVYFRKKGLWMSPPPPTGIKGQENQR